ncbi:MAG: hypothetical protein K1W02_15595 [Muribaculaceae bacterium]
MKRSLLTQIKNEWRDNIWMTVELAVVVIAIWLIMTFLYLLTAGLFTERGFDPEDVYVLQARNVSKSSPEYVETGDSTWASLFDDRAALLQRLREHKDVESVALSGGAIPYNYNYNGNMISVPNEPDSIFYSGNFRYGSPDIVKALGLRSLTGTSPDKLVEMLERGEILISDNDAYVRQGRDPFALKGKMVIFGQDSSKTYRVGDIIANIRRNDYEEARAGTVLVPIDEKNKWAYELAIKVKPGHGDSFKEAFKNDKSLQRQRNMYFTDLKSLMDKREGNQRSLDTKVRMFAVVMGFLLLTIFLGLLGTFWFRMQQRVSEIAIRKVCGATKVQIFMRIFGEGMILLGFAVIIASAIVWPFSHYAIDQAGIEWYEILIFELVAIGLVALGILLSVIYPARKAMNIEPAIAIKDE